MPVARRIRPPTAKEMQVLEFVEKYMADNGYAPSLKEVQAEMGAKSVGSASACLAALERKGLVERVPGVARGLRVLKRPAKRAK